MLNGGTGGVRRFSIRKVPCHLVTDSTSDVVPVPETHRLDGLSATCTMILQNILLWISMRPRGCRRAMNVSCVMVYSVREEGEPCNVAKHPLVSDPAT